MKKRIAVFAATLVLGGSTMFGGTITQTMSFGPATTDITDPVSVKTFQDFLNFGVAGGVLQSVTLEVLINETVTSLSITNLSAQAQTFRYSTSGFYAVNGTAPAADLTNLNNAIPG